MKKIVLLLFLAGLGAGGYWLYEENRRAGLERSGEIVLYGNVDIRDVALGFRVFGRIAELRFEEGDRVKAGETLFTGDNPEPATFPRLVQGSLERSNVRSVVEMSRMIEITRAYEQVSNFLSSTDQLSSDAINALGQVS